MSELSTRESFIVRIYRVNTDDRRKISGLVEILDGSGRREPFTHIDELGAVLNGSTRRPANRRGGNTGDQAPGAKPATRHPGTRRAPDTAGGDGEG